jgi:small conductance mechanosensitive channel
MKAIKFLFIGLLLLAGTVTPLGSAFAQLSPLPAPAETAPAAEAPKKPTEEQIKSFIKTMEDPQAREAFIANLRAMQEVAAPKPVEAPSMKALDAVSKAAADAGKSFSSIINSFADLPKATRWFERQWQSEEARAAWLEIFIQAMLALVAGTFVLVVLDILLKRPREYIGNLPPPTVLAKVITFGGYHLLNLLPVVGFTAAALFTLNSFGMPVHPERAVTAILYAFISFQLLVWILRMMFSARLSRQRLLPLDDESAAYLFVWSQRLGGMIVFGFFLAQAALAMEMPEGSVHAFSAFIGLIVTVMVIIIILQNRSNVAIWLRGRKEAATQDAATPRANFWQLSRMRLAEIWHILAIAYLGVGFLVASLDIQNGFGTLLRATIITLVTLVVFRFILSGIDHLVERGFALPKELKAQFPMLEERTNSYLPVLQRVLKGLAWIAGILILLNAWGVDTVAWFATPLGKKVIVSSISISLTVFFTVVLWEIVNSFTERFLRGRNVAGEIVKRSARMMTLMPLLRHSLHTIMIAVAGLFILSELGVDITPLLAGAGIIGLAIGFGAQTLVKDFITGVFILFEDTIAVGDVVEIGTHSGFVEEITIRTLKLRDLEGRVHTIPFSDVTSVINMAKYFSYAVVEVGVGYDADLRNIMQVMKHVADEMSNDPAWRSMIYEPMDMQGVERFDPSSIAIRARIKTQPLKQWAVRREYLLRLKDAFDKEGIEIPFPINTTIHIAKEAAPPLPGHG